MPFKGQLVRQVPFTVEISNSPNSVTSHGVTLSFVVKQDRIAQVKIFTVPRDSPPIVQEYTAGLNHTRVIIEVNLSAPGSAVVKVTQGTSRFEDPITQDTTFVYDFI